MAFAFVEVADKIPHPALATWIAVHVALAACAWSVLRRPFARRTVTAVALAWFACTSVWFGSFFVSPDSIDEGFVEAVGLPYLVAVLLTSALPAAAAIASTRQRASTEA